MKNLHAGFIGAAASALSIVATAQVAQLPVWKTKAQVLQRLEAFDNPEGAIFSVDGKFAFVSNAAELGNPAKGHYWTHKAGYISKLAVLPDGTLTMLNEKLVTGLTGPLGMAVSTVATRKFPQGTVFVAEAWLPLAEPDGTEVRDPKRLDPRIVAFDAGGKILGAIRLGAGSSAAKVSGVVATQANSLAFDGRGNLYLADTGVSGDKFVPPVLAKGGGIYRFPVSSLDALAEGIDAPLHYLPVPNGGPDGIEVATDGTIHFNTVGLNAGLPDPAKGGMYRLSQEELMASKLPAPFKRDLGALDGLQFVGSLRLDTEARNTNGIVVTPASGATSYRLDYDRPFKVSGPADIAVRRLPEGGWLVLLPELSSTAPNATKDPVTVLRLPADF